MCGVPLPHLQGAVRHEGGHLIADGSDVHVGQRNAVALRIGGHTREWAKNGTRVLGNESPFRCRPLSIM